MADTLQVERQLYILALLSESRNGCTIEEIMNNLAKAGIDVSKKTVARDLDSITQNFFVYEEERNNKTAYKVDKFNINNLSFSIMELISLYFNREILKNYNIDVGATAFALIDRMISSMPYINRSYIDALNDTFKIEDMRCYCDKAINPDFLALIREAVADRRNLEIEYHSFNSDETTKREFSPYLLEVQEGCYHLIGHCHLRNGIRDLRVSRIQGLRLVGARFERPENFFESYKQDKFSKLAGNERIELKLRFKRDAARYIKEYELSKADGIEECGNGEIIFNRTTTLTPEVIKWILGFADQVVVLSPDEVRTEVIRQAKSLLASYCGN